MSAHIHIESVPSHGDGRGFSHSVPKHALSFLRGVSDAHVAELNPGGVRGNHYHVQRHELLLIRHEDRWTLYYDQGESTTVQEVTFDGSGLVTVKVPPLCSHAVKNIGNRPLIIVALSDVEYSPDAPDTVARAITP